MSNVPEFGRRSRAVLVVGVFTALAFSLATVPAAAGSSASGDSDASTSTTVTSTTSTAPRNAAREAAAEETTAARDAARESAPRTSASKRPSPPPTPPPPTPPAPGVPGTPPAPGVPGTPPVPGVPVGPPAGDANAPLPLPPGVNSNTPAEPHIITEFADELNGPRRGAGPRPNPQMSVPVARDVDGCDRNYGEITQCVPKVLPNRQTDVCAYLAQRGIKGVRVKGGDPKQIDRNRNGVVCD